MAQSRFRLMDGHAVCETRLCSINRTTSTSPGIPTRISPLATDATSASATPWRAWRPPFCFAPCFNDTPPSLPRGVGQTRNGGPPSASGVRPACHLSCVQPLAPRRTHDPCGLCRSPARDRHTTEESEAPSLPLIEFSSPPFIRAEWEHRDAGDGGPPTTHDRGHPNPPG